MNMKNYDWQYLSVLLEKLQLDENKVGGSLVVYSHGKCVVETSIGYARENDLWSADTLSLNFSTGKGVLATLVHCIVSQGLLDYDLPISSYWPEFAINGKNEITLRQVMSHQANLYAIDSIIDDSNLMLDWKLMVDKVAAMPLSIIEHKKDLRYSTTYNALVYGWILGELITRVTSLSIQDALDQYLAKPLGIQGQVMFGVSDAQANKIAIPERLFETKLDESVLDNRTRRKPVLKPDSDRVLKTYSQFNCYSQWQSNYLALTNEGKNFLTTADINRLFFDPALLNLNNYKSALMPNAKQQFDYYQINVLKAVIPAVNCVASAKALAVIYSMLANKGSFNGYEFIDKQTFEIMTQIQNQGVDAVMPAIEPNSMLWRLGYHRVFSKCHDVTHAFGHIGYNGSMAWCDPSRNLSVSFVHNVDTTMLNDIRQFAINEAILYCCQ